MANSELQVKKMSKPQTLSQATALFGTGRPANSKWLLKAADTAGLPPVFTTVG